MASLNNSMRTVLFTVLFLLGLMAYPATSHAQKPNKRLHEKCLYPTVLVTPTGTTSYGTGFIVRSFKIEDNLYCNVFLTCAHVIDESALYEVNLYEYEDWSKIKGTKTFSAAVYARNDKDDTAVGLFLSDKQLHAVTLDFNPKLYIGNKVWRIGCGMGDDPRLDEGKLTAVRTNMGRLKNVIRTSIETVPGDSGSPVFHRYKVIGLTQSIRAWKGLPIFHMTYAVPLERFQTWDKESNGALDFIWTENAVPVIPLWRLKFMQQYENSHFH